MNVRDYNAVGTFGEKISDDEKHNITAAVPQKIATFNGEMYYEDEELLELDEEKGNFHEITGGSKQGCAFFDVVFPPYNGE